MSDMLDKWVAMSDSGKVEIEVSQWFQTLTEDIITRTVFGSSYKDGKAIFRLQAQLMALTSEAFQKVFIPGYRYVINPLHILRNKPCIIILLSITCISFGNFGVILSFHINSGLASEIYRQTDAPFMRRGRRITTEAFN